MANLNLFLGTIEIGTIEDGEFKSYGPIGNIATSFADDTPLSPIPTSYTATMPLNMSKKQTAALWRWVMGKFCHTRRNKKQVHMPNRTRKKQRLTRLQRRRKRQNK